MPPVTRRKLPEPDTTVVNFSSLTKREQFKLAHAPSSLQDPAKVFDRKVEQLAELLGCTEAEATYELLHRL